MSADRTALYCDNGRFYFFNTGMLLQQKNYDNNALFSYQYGAKLRDVKFSSFGATYTIPDGTAFTVIRRIPNADDDLRIPI